MSPDRVIVGEARGEEVLALLNAMSQGTDGSMATLHASSSRGAFSKLATYAVQAPERLPLEATNLLVANAVHFVIHLAQDGERRFVASVREVVDAEGPMVVSNEIFRPGPDGRAVPGVAAAQRDPRPAGRRRLRPRPAGPAPRVVGAVTAPWAPCAGPGSASGWSSSGSAGAASTFPARPGPRPGPRSNGPTCASAWPSAPPWSWGRPPVGLSAPCWPPWPAGAPPGYWAATRGAHGGGGAHRGRGRMGRDAARHHGRRGRAGTGHRRHRPTRPPPDPGRGGHPGRAPGRRAPGPGAAGVRRRGGRPDLRPGRGRPDPGRRAPGPTPGRAAGLPRPSGPGPGHHAPAGRGRPGPDPHLGQGHRRRHRRPGPRPGRAQPRLPRPLRQRRRPAGPAARGRSVRRGVRVAGQDDPTRQRRTVPRATDRS